MKITRSLVATLALAATVAACAQNTRAPDGRSANTTNAQAVASSTMLKPVQDRNLMVQPFNMSVARIKGMDVHTADGRKVGDVGDVLADGNGRIVGLHVNAGGFLGMGARHVIMPIGQVRMQGDRLITNMSREQIENLPAYVG